MKQPLKPYYYYSKGKSLIKSIEVKRYLLANLETECQAEVSNQQLSQRRNSTRVELNELIA